MQLLTEGEVPGEGRYRCTRCGWVVRLDDPSDSLPECRGKCEAQTRTEYRKIGSDDEPEDDY